ncbi:MAG: hypothetical protein KAS12_06210 [Candidatus Aenigmarchaeota archaeon]|nr:hypothetical protein [Candidatus Aenigmarchaeota archaeon]
MDLKEAIIKIEESNDFEEKLKNKQLCSAISFTDEKNEPTKWEINYFNDESGKITRVVVDDTVEIFKEDELFKKDAVSPIDISLVHITATEALKIAADENEKNYKQPVQKMFVALHSENPPVWSVNIITKLLTVIQMKLSVDSGKILDIKTHNMFQGKGVAK